MRVTPEDITPGSLRPMEMFVFGSNESGLHGAGAARIAVDDFRARMGQGFGHAGQTFAIPTKDWEIRTLELDDISFYVRRFIAYANLHRKLKFFVTQIGCGLAGYTPEEIAPMFASCLKMKNVYLPQSFIDVIKKLEYEKNN